MWQPQSLLLLLRVTWCQPGLWLTGLVIQYTVSFLGFLEDGWCSLSLWGSIDSCPDSEVGSHCRDGVSLRVTCVQECVQSECRCGMKCVSVYSILSSTAWLNFCTTMPLILQTTHSLRYFTNCQAAQVSVGGGVLWPVIVSTGLWMQHTFRDVRLRFEPTSNQLQLKGNYREKL